jgi:type VI secretion system secreted protein VgrG
VPGNKGKNEISCEDRAGKEEIFVHAQRDLNEHILRNHNETIGANQSSTVGANQTVSVGANQTVTVTGNRELVVMKDETIKVSGTRTETVADGEFVTITSGRHHTVATGDDVINVAEGNRVLISKQTHFITSNRRKENVATDIDISAGTSVLLRHELDAVLELKAGEATLNTANKITLTNGQSSITLDGDTITITAKSKLALCAGAATLAFSADGTITGSGSKEVSLSCQDSQMKLDPQKAALAGAGIDVTAVGKTVLGGAIIMIG